MEGKRAAGTVSNLPPERLDDVDRRTVRETREELLAAPAPTDHARFGVPTAILGLVVLVAWPRIVDSVPAGGFVSPFVLLAGALMLIGGPVLAVMGGGGGGRGAEAAVEASLRRLEDPETDRQTALRAATILITHAFWSRGPATFQTFEADEAAARIGPRLPIVIAVEEHLVSNGSAYPVFTLALEDD